MQGKSRPHLGAFTVLRGRVRFLRFVFLYWADFDFDKYSLLMDQLTQYLDRTDDDWKIRVQARENMGGACYEREEINSRSALSTFTKPAPVEGSFPGFERSLAVVRRVLVKVSSFVSGRSDRSKAAVPDK